MNTIVMTVWARHHLLRRALEAWSNVRGVEDWRFVFMVEPSSSQFEALTVLDCFEHPAKTVVKNPYRYGVLTNPHVGLDLVFSGGEQFAVLAEEDLIPSQNILEYFSFGRDWLRNQDDILAVCAHGEGSDPHSVVIRDKFSVWLWGTWRDRWAKYLRDTWDHDYSSGEGHQSGWDWNIELRVRPNNNLRCLYPMAPLVDHIGIVGSHMTPQQFIQTRPVGFQEELPERPFKVMSPK